MADLLPSIPDTSAAEDAEPRVVGLDDDEADDLLAALSAGTARELLTTLHEDPGSPADLADRVDTSLQNAQYHLEKLENAGVIEVIDTAYSAKGREMDVYAPADRPLVVFAGEERERSTLRTALSRLLGALGILAAVSLAIEAVLGETLDGLLGRDDAVAVDEPEPVADDDAEIAAEAPEAAPEPMPEEALGLPPGVLFFAGGLLVMTVTFGIWYWQTR